MILSSCTRSRKEKDLYPRSKLFNPHEKRYKSSLSRDISPKRVKRIDSLGLANADRAVAPNHHRERKKGLVDIEPATLSTTTDDDQRTITRSPLSPFRRKEKRKRKPQPNSFVGLSSFFLSFPSFSQTQIFGGPSCLRITVTDVSVDSFLLPSPWRELDIAGGMMDSLRSLRCVFVCARLENELVMGEGRGMET